MQAFQAERSIKILYAKIYHGETASKADILSYVAFILPHLVPGVDDQ